MFRLNVLALSLVFTAGQGALALDQDSAKIIAVQQAEISHLKALQAPVGTILPIASNISGSWQPPAPGVVKNGFMLCDGSAIPPGNALSGNTPALVDSRFLMGSTRAGATGGNETLPDHTHSFSLAVGTGWTGTVSGNTADAQVSSNRDQGGQVGTPIQGNQGLPTLNNAAYNSVSVIAGSSHHHTWSGSVTGSLNSGAVSGSVGTGVKASEARFQPKYSTVVYVIRVN